MLSKAFSDLKPIPALLIGWALFCSGSAGLLNEVVWQRSLKRFLGGSETISSMTVVLVFMAGLGIGSIAMGRRASRVKNPLLLLGLIELLLWAVNLGVCAILSSNVSDSVFTIQKAASLSGIPLPILYVFSALLILMLPCLLMGATMPLASEVCQRQLRLNEPRVLGLLFFINTLGSTVGSIVGSGYLIPNFGLSRSLILASSLNFVAFVLLLLLQIKKVPIISIPEKDLSPIAPGAKRSFRYALLAFGFGFCSLGYEILLFRLFALNNEPLPYVFAAVLSGFLLFWSLGASLSSARIQLSLQTGLLVSALTILLIPMVFLLDRPVPVLGLWGLLWFILPRFPYFLPCLCFGYLFTRLSVLSAKNWGQDIGTIYAWNTAGSCLGILAMTFIGNEMHFFSTLVILAFLLLTLRAYESLGDTAANLKMNKRWVYPLACTALITVFSLRLDLSQTFSSTKLFFGRDGVIGVDLGGGLFWDGLWHSKLSKDNDHIGTKNWYLGVCPAVLHSSGDIREVGVIGVGTGITATTLSKIGTVENVDAYDINHTLLEIFKRYPDGTLNLTDNKKIHIIWQDARTGLALNSKKYDVIYTQPLYLKQSGSSLLNSVEFYRLVYERLKPGGVFCLYSRGTPGQALVLRNTAAQVFPYGESFFDGYLMVLSNEPLLVNEEALTAKFSAHVGDPFWNELRGYGETKDANSFLRLMDSPRLLWSCGDLIVTDDFPIIEYPDFIEERLRK